MAEAVRTRVVGVEGTRIVLDGEPFPLTGVSFFNALYNPTFNANAAARAHWLRVFRDHGVNTLRVWCQWDFNPPRTFIDIHPRNSLYTDEGALRERFVRRLEDLLLAADALGMVIEVTYFSHERVPQLPPDVLERGARALTERLKPYRNLIAQVWNEDSTEIMRLVAAMREVDPARVVTNSPGISNVLGDDAQNETLDLLTPHTDRYKTGERFVEIAPRQVAGLIERFRKPVIDDEPARSGPTEFGGISGGTRPEWHIAQIRAVRECGGYPIYHHDMFQYGYDSPLTPPSGIPEPDFNPFHRQVFAYLRDTK